MLPYIYLNTEEMKEKHNFLVLDGNEIVGLMQGPFLLGHIEYYDDGDNEIFIEMIEVTSSFQKLGHSTRLIEKLKEWYPGTVSFNGLSTPHAVSYWQAKGASFEPSTFVEYDETQTNYEGTVFPFSLSLTEGHVPYWLNP